MGKRAVVIGAGHNGLVAAIVLARHGVDVTVLEHAPVPGGATRSVANTLPGFVHDLCAAFMPMTAVSPAMQELGLNVDWIVPDAVVAHPFDDGQAIALARDVDATAASLGGAAGAAWTEAMRELLPVAQSIATAVLSRVPPVRSPVRVGARLRGDAIEWIRRAAGSVEALG